MAYNDVVYWSATELQEVPANAEILAIGDSWFHYPVYGGSLINTIGDLVKPTGKRILVCGGNGLEIQDFAAGKYNALMLNMFRLYGSSCQALLISGGGNDFAGFSDLRPLLKADCSNETTAQACFKPGTPDEVETLPWLLALEEKAYQQVITEAKQRMSSKAVFVLHNYDYAPPTGKGFLGGKGWIKSALVAAKVPKALHFDCVKYIIDEHTKLLERVARTDMKRIFVVDSRGTLSAEHWANELHPNKEGFALIVTAKWAPLLKKLKLSS